MKHINQCISIIQIFGVINQNSASSYDSDLGLIDRKVYDDEQDYMSDLKEMYAPDEEVLGYLPLLENETATFNCDIGSDCNTENIGSEISMPENANSKNASTKESSKKELKGTDKKDGKNSTQTKSTKSKKTISTTKDKTKGQGKTKDQKKSKTSSKKSSKSGKKGEIKKVKKIPTLKEEAARMMKKYGYIKGNTYEFLDIPEKFTCTAYSVAFLICWHKDWNADPDESRWDNSRYYCSIWDKKRGNCIHVSDKGDVINKAKSMLRLEDVQDWSRNANLFCTIPNKQGNYNCSNYTFKKISKCVQTTMFGKKPVNKCEDATNYDLMDFECKPQDGEFVTCFDKSKITKRVCYRLKFNKKYWRCNTSLLSKYHKNKELFVIYRSFLKNPNDPIIPGWSDKS